MPHIVATASTDGTTRLWNIHGAPPPPIPPEERSENYPMGDADEGTECLAILGGQWYGHREKVVHCVSEPFLMHRHVTRAYRLTRRPFTRSTAR
jgi:hypothetical protein